jgi:hypothetical protein
LGGTAKRGIKARHWAANGISGARFAASMLTSRGEHSSMPCRPHMHRINADGEEQCEHDHSCDDQDGSMFFDPVHSLLSSRRTEAGKRRVRNIPPRFEPANLSVGSGTNSRGSRRDSLRQRSLRQHQSAGSLLIHASTCRFMAVVRLRSSLALTKLTPLHFRARPFQPSNRADEGPSETFARTALLGTHPMLCFFDEVRKFTLRNHFAGKILVQDSPRPLTNLLRSLATPPQVRHVHCSSRLRFHAQITECLPQLDHTFSRVSVDANVTRRRPRPHFVRFADCLAGHNYFIKLLL